MAVLPQMFGFDLNTLVQHCWHRCHLCLKIVVSSFVTFLVATLRCRVDRFSAAGITDKTKKNAAISKINQTFREIGSATGDF
jgi:hypothetical protein